ncbi:MAG TPA: hypothetical protein ENI23_10035 [bacterium]|nr:hypothetical protein [bacterium]
MTKKIERPETQREKDAHKRLGLALTEQDKAIQEARKRWNGKSYDKPDVESLFDEYSIALFFTIKKALECGENREQFLKNASLTFIICDGCLPDYNKE